MSKNAAKGAVLQVKNVTWQTVPSVGDFNFAPFEIDSIDVTTHDSPNNYEEKITGIKKAPKISIPVVWDESNPVHAFLTASQGTVQPFSYQGAGYTAAYKFNAIITISWENPVKGARKATLQLEISDGNTPT
jgi:hypothetical protein